MRRRGLLQTRVGMLLTLVAALWILEIADQLLLRESLDRFGIWPRQLTTLWHVLTAPWLHVGFGHVAANSVPLLVLGWLVLLRGHQRFWRLTLDIAVLGGLAVWLLGRGGTVHLGASLLLFGYLGFLLSAGYHERSFRSILIALVVVSLYGGALWGVLPGQPGVSWESHLFGFLAGAVAGNTAYWRERCRPREDVQGA